MRRLLFALYRAIAVRGAVTLGPNVHVGIGSRVWAPSGLNIGQDVYIGKFCTVECNGIIGPGSLIANSVGLVGRSDHDIHQVGVPVRLSRWAGTNTHLQTSISVGRDCWIGFGAIVLGSVSIGDSSIVAAGSVVTRDIPENSICAGNPAIVIRSRFTEGDYLDHKRALDVYYAK